MSGTAQDSDGGLIAPDDKAGFSATDVLKQAEEGDEIELEMEFQDRPFEVVRGDVMNVVEESIETDRMIRKTVQVDSRGSTEEATVQVEYDTQSANVTVCQSVRFVKRGADDYVFGNLDELVHAELSKNGDDDE